jgi:uncharacterized protein (DUF1330 family)
MSAYLIFTRDKTLDEHELATDSKDSPATLARHEVKVLAFYGSHEDLEGASTGGSVILEFPSYRGGEGLVQQSVLSQGSSASFQRRDVSRHFSTRSLGRRLAAISPSACRR